MNVWLVYLLLVRATVVSFSGFASIPIVREDFIERRRVLSDEQLNAAIAISQTSPGALGLYVVVVGYFVAGLPGALAGMAALATPALLALPLLKLVRRQHASVVRGASAGIVIASSVLMTSSGLGLATSVLSSPLLVGIAVAGLAALALERLSPVVVVASGAAFSLLLSRLS